MAKFDAVFVGFVTLDILGRPVIDIPEGGGIAFLDEIALTPAGTCGGSVANAGKLGVNCQASFCVGADSAGDFVIDRLTRLGVNCDLAQRSQTTQTSMTILPIRPNGDRPCLHRRGASEEFFISDGLFDAICDARFMHHGGTGFIRAMESGQSTKLLRHAKSRGLTVSFDLIGPNEGTLAQLRDTLPYVDYFMPSLQEAEQISGLKGAAENARFYMGLGAAGCIFKDGANGSYIKTADADFALPAFEIVVSDTTGCGDAYCGGFIAGLTMGYDLEEACRLGTATSALVASGLGSDAVVRNLDTTLEFMASARTLPRQA